MAQNQDIRAFFGAPAAKKRRTSTSTSAVTAVVDQENAGSASLNTTADATNAPGDSTKHEPVASTESTGSEPTRDVVDGPLEHQLKNLQHNARFLMHASWFQQLESEFSRPYFRSLVAFLTAEEAKKKTIYPAPENVFGTLRDCPFTSLKVVILGQDPYHGPNQAHGLSFSVLSGIAPPPSLGNIYKEAISDVKITRPHHGCLTGWSKQGVLMLNTVLTVRRGEPNSHKNQGWEKLTDAIIARIDKNASNVVFLLWGKPAQVKGTLINKSKHLVLTSSHPSPLGATKTNEPFIGSKCFSKTNAYLKQHNKDPIDWNAL